MMMSAILFPLFDDISHLSWAQPEVARKFVVIPPEPGAHPHVARFPAVNDIENVYLYDIDDLKELSQAHLSDRLEESRKAHAIVDEEVHKFNQRLKELEMNPLIGRIRENMEAIRTGELKRTLQKLKSADPETTRQLDMLTRAIVNKIVHPHLMMIKKNGSPAVLDLIKNLLLSGEEDEKEMDSRNEGE